MTFYDYCKENDKMNYIKCWSEKNAFTPKDVTQGSKQKAIFVCDICGYESEKVIHDIRKLKDFHCKECEKRQREKKSQEKRQQKKIEKENKKQNKKQNKPDFVLKDYIPLDKLNHKTKEFHSVMEVVEKRVYRKKNGEISSIKFFCKDAFSKIDFIIRTSEDCFKDFEIGSFVDVKCMRTNGYYNPEIKVNAITKITKEQYDQIEQSFIEKKNKNLKTKEQENLKKQQKIELFNQLPIEKRYLMLDVETNGLKSKEDDLLEIAIYRPDTDTMFHKLLPLTKQKKVLTTQYNGLTKAKLKGATHLTEKDVKTLINDFEIDKRVLLHYGDLDAPFIKNYFQEHKLLKMSLLKFYNFKNQIISSRFSNRDIDGGISKDNLCKMYGIDGVLETHDCQNDCILQWKLFQKIHNKNLIIIDNKLFSVPENSNYLIPSSFLNYSRIQNILKNPLPNIVVNEHIVYNKKKNNYIELCFKNCLPFIRNVFGPAAVGQMIEHQINCLLNVRQYESFSLFLENKKQLVYEGSFVGVDNEIPATFNKDGSLTLEKTPKLTEEEREKLQKILDVELEELRKTLKEYLISYLQKNVFCDKQIYSQEVVINKEDGVISKCDLSNEYAICEIKNTKHHIDYYKYQLWYQQHSEQLDDTVAKSDKKRNLYTIVISQDELNETNIIIRLLKIDFDIYKTPTEANRYSFWKRPKSYNYEPRK